MPADLLSELNSKDLKEFKKDFNEILRVNSGIDKEYAKGNKKSVEDISKQVSKWIFVVNICLFFLLFFFSVFQF